MTQYRCVVDNHVYDDTYDLGHICKDCRQTVNDKHCIHLPYDGGAMCFNCMHKPRNADLWNTIIDNNKVQ